MSKYYSLLGGTTTDTEIQVAQENQIVIGFGPYMLQDRYVIFQLEHTANGYLYLLVNLDTKEIRRTDILEPLSRKYGIGLYYDDVNHEQMDAMEVAALACEAQEKARIKAEKAEAERKRADEQAAIGRKRLAEILPLDAKAMIVARLREDESDPMTDYFSSRTVRTVILGFSRHTRDLFSEMRKYAANMPETAYLSEPNEEYEHREKYSMGGGYYLGESRYSGWIIQKVPVGDRERTIREFGYTAGDEANIRLKAPAAEPNPEDGQNVIKGEFMIVDYSEKAIALFGDTRPIKDALAALGGRFNSRLTHEGGKRAGWIFPKTRSERVKALSGAQTTSTGADSPSRLTPNIKYLTDRKSSTKIAVNELVRLRGGTTWTRSASRCTGKWSGTTDYGILIDGHIHLFVSNGMADSSPVCANGSPRSKPSKSRRITTSNCSASRPGATTPRQSPRGSTRFTSSTSASSRPRLPTGSITSIPMY